MIDFRKNEALVKKFPDQFEGFKVFGCDFKKEFDGTIFRFPLRTVEQASVSRISHRGHSVYLYIYVLHTLLYSLPSTYMPILVFVYFYPRFVVLMTPFFLFLSPCTS